MWIFQIIGMGLLFVVMPWEPATVIAGLFAMNTIDTLQMVLS